MTFYNENDPKAAAWLRELIKADLIAPGVVDERSIADLKAADLHGYTQCHFFAGIGGWSYALRLAGRPDDEAVWTGSCPCQPFSAAGKRKVDKDERHLWPAFRELIAQCRPAIVFGEQVASKDGRIWLARVRTDLEALGYAVGAADLCAAGVGAPHIRQRLYWMAVSQQQGREGQGITRSSAEARQIARSGAHGGLVDADSTGSAETNGHGRSAFADGSTERLGEPESEQARLPGLAWRQSDTVSCADGKSRRIEPGTFPLVARLPGGVVPNGNPSIAEAQASAEFRVARLRGYGNSIVPQLATEFIKASVEALTISH